MTGWTHSIAALFAEHRTRLEALVRRRIRDRDAASDIVQDVFTRVFVAGTRGSAEDDRRVLYTAARNAVIDHNRILSGRQSVLAALMPEQVVASPVSEDRALESREAIAALDRALMTLPPRKQCADRPAPGHFH
jgi:DNA-directed RNA polymerase specialized sigma24 family protein